jgi:hypothetical protein
LTSASAAAAVAAAAAAAGAAVVGGNGDDGRGDDSNGGSDGGGGDSGCSGSVVAAMVVAEATATATVMTADATAGVKKQQSTSDGNVEGGRWTRARRRVTNNNESAWPMMRAVTKRAVRAMAMVTRVADERRQRR